MCILEQSRLYGLRVLRLSDAYMYVTSIFLCRLTSDARKSACCRHKFHDRDTEEDSAAKDKEGQ